MPYRNEVVIAACLASLFAGAGCGSASKTLTRDQLISRADAICKRVNVERKGATVASAQSLGPALVRIGESETSAVSQLAQLKAPHQLDSDWAEILKADDMLAHYTVAYGRDLAAHNIIAARIQIRIARKPEHEMQTLATEDGFKDCAEFG